MENRHQIGDQDAQMPEDQIHADRLPDREAQAQLWGSDRHEMTSEESVSPDETVREETRDKATRDEETLNHETMSRAEDVEDGAMSPRASGVAATVADGRAMPGAKATLPRPAMPYSQMKYLHASRANPTDGAQNWRAGFLDLPLINRGFFLCAAALLTIALLRVTGPPVTGAVASVVHPYTSTGKQETCLNNLQYLAKAIALYTADHDNRYPPLEYTGATGSRVTWVTLLQRQTGGKETLRHMLCPLGGRVSDVMTIGNYGLNPVLPLAKSDAFSDPAGTLLLADRAQDHDVSLLPPFPGWPMNDNANPAAHDTMTKAANVDFRHRHEADVVYADGHVGVLQGSSSTHDLLQRPATWGGSPLFAKAMERLLSQYPVLRDTVEPRDAKAVRRMLMQQKAQAWPASQQVLTLWQRNETVETAAVETAAMETADNGDTKAVAGGKTDVHMTSQNEALEKWGWRLGGMWDAVGEPAMLQQLQQIQSKRSVQLLAKLTAHDWQMYQSDWGFSLERPQGWTISTEVEGRYHNTFFRSGSPHIRVALERGEHQTFKVEAAVDWSGMERDMQRQFPQSYKRREMRTIIWGGQEAGLWLFETKRADGPRLCKMYVGRRHDWESYVLTAVAPAADYWQWQSVFDRFLGSFMFR